MLIIKSFTVSDTEITKAENLLQNTAFGEDTLGFGLEEINVLNAINFYFDDVTLEATKNRNGNITLKYTGIFEGETNYVIYEVNTKNRTVNFVGSSFDWDWEIYKDYFQTDLFNSYS